MAWLMLFTLVSPGSTILRTVFFCVNIYPDAAPPRIPMMIEKYLMILLPRTTLWWRRDSNLNHIPCNIHHSKLNSPNQLMFDHVRESLIQGHSLVHPKEGQVQFGQLGHDWNFLERDQTHIELHSLTRNYRGSSSLFEMNLRLE